MFRSEPDGYTLFATPQGPLVISQSFFRKLGFDPTQFVPITIMAKLPYILVVHPKVPVSTFAEFIAYAKANPGKLNYATPSVGSSPHLTTEMLKLAAGLEMTQVPYSGFAPALNDLMAGHVEVMFDNLGNSLPLVREGKLKGLAVTSDQRAPELPDLPTVAETYPRWWRRVGLPSSRRRRPRRRSPTKLSQRVRRDSARARGREEMARDVADPGRRHARRGRSLPQGGDGALAERDRHRRHQAAMTTANRGSSGAISAKTSPQKAERPSFGPMRAWRCVPALGQQ